MALVHAMGDANAQRIALARRALIEPGYFTEDEVGDDIAPRISELLSAIRDGKFDPFHKHPANEPCPESCPMHGRDPGAAWTAAGALAQARLNEEAGRRFYATQVRAAERQLGEARGDELMDDE